jgi:5'(3')-deoxyribonucleotidase
MNNMEKKILYCDLDGCIADFEAGIKRINPIVVLNEDNKEANDIVTDIVKADPMFFQNLPPLVGAVDAVKDLMEHYLVIFCSTPMEDVPHSFTGKKEWLNEHFGDKAYKNLKLTHHKHLCLGDYLIDDRLKNGAGQFKGEHIHFATEKFPDWDSVLKYLIK